MENPAQTLSASASDFQRDLSRYWRHARRQGGVTLTQQGWIYKSGFKSFLTALNVASTLQNADEQSNGRLWFMRRMLVQMHELQGDNFSDHLAVASPSKLLTMPMAQRVRWAFESWRDGGVWNELLRLAGQSAGFDPRREAPAPLAKSRGVVLRTLARLGQAKVPVLVSPGSTRVKLEAEREGLDQIFKKAGFEWRESGCSMCVGMNGDLVAAGKRCASTSNRNFVGRQGPGSRTHLMGPAMAAAAALTGRLTDVRSLVK